MAEIYTYPNPHLDIVCVPVVEFDDELSRVADILVASIPSNGLAVAANQIGFNRSMFAYRMPGDTPKVLCNPRIVSGRGTWSFREGCLSLPGLFFPIDRPRHIVVEGQSITGESMCFVASDLKARVLQHECEHLNGRLLLSRLTPALRNKAKLAMGLQKGRGTV